MKLIQKVTKIVSQLKIYRDKGANKLSQVTNISYDTQFSYFIKCIFLYELLKFSKSIKESVWLKIKLTKKVTNIASQLPIYYDQGTNNLEQVTNTSRNVRFVFFFKSISLEELLKFSHLQKGSFGWTCLVENEAN